MQSIVFHRPSSSIPLSLSPTHPHPTPQRPRLFGLCCCARGDGSGTVWWRSGSVLGQANRSPGRGGGSTSQMAQRAQRAGARARQRLTSQIERCRAGCDFGRAIVLAWPIFQPRSGVRRIRAVFCANRRRGRRWRFVCRRRNKRCRLFRRCRERVKTLCLCVNRHRRVGICSHRRSTSSKFCLRRQ